MGRNMFKLATQKTIGFEASIFNAKGEKMMTFHLEAQMANMVRFPKRRWRADFDKSQASQVTFSQQLSHRTREEPAKLDSRNANFAGPSVGGTECPGGDLSDEPPDEYMDDADDECMDDGPDQEFWTTTVDENGTMTHTVKQL
jgi:hypothetical protein